MEEKTIKIKLLYPLHSSHFSPLGPPPYGRTQGRRDGDSNGTMIPLPQAKECQRIAGYIQTAAF
ncbi:hypothetical protein DPMN_186003 [Dreissena polymorpha]|uniref:Uncharacterized protein n=1 Tax=Dreissena polymorpha TaxID=45954 RepID=A0A9D4DNB9_DREPO|nr:hypothetical protein DPMN_186003 [Dreissena polymorpha]